MKRNQKWILLSALLVIACLFAGCLSSIHTSDYQNADEYMTGNFAYFAEDIRVIQVHWYSGEVKFVESDSRILSVTENGESLSEKEQLHWYVKDGVLRIEFCAANYSSRIPSSQKHLMIEVPAGISILVNNTGADVILGTHQMGSVDIYSIGGNIQIDSLTATEVDIGSISGSIKVGAATVQDSVDLITTSGKIELGTVAANTLEMSSVSGDLLVQAATVTDEAEIETISGDIELEQLTADTLELSSTSGEIELGLGGCSKASIVNNSGEVNLTLVNGLGATVTHRSTSGQFYADNYRVSAGSYVFGDGLCQLNIETVSGRVSVK